MRPLGRVVLPCVVAILVVVGLTGEIPGGYGSRESTGVVAEATRPGAGSMLGPAIDVEALKESLPAGLFPVVVESLQSETSRRKLTTFVKVGATSGRTSLTIRYTGSTSNSAAKGR